MATIKVLNASQANPEAPVEIKLGVVNEPDKPIQYVGIPGPEGKPGKDGKQGPQGPKGDTPIKGVDYFTSQDIADIAAQVPVPEVDLTDYASKSFVETAIRGAETGLLKRSVVQVLPISEIDDNTIYMVPKVGSTGDVYDEYLYINNTWEHIGSTDVDLTGYATEEYVDTQITNLQIKKKYIITLEPDLYNGIRIANMPLELKNKLMTWYRSLNDIPNGGINYDAYSQGIEDFEVYVNYFQIHKVDNIVIQKHNQWDSIFMYFLSMNKLIAATNNDTYYHNELILQNPYTLLRIKCPQDNSQDFIGAVEGRNYSIRYCIPAGQVRTNMAIIKGDHTYNDVNSILRIKQNKLTAGPGISISNDVISTNIDYLTNSDVLAIWNGNNE